MKVSLSEKGGLPNTIRILIGGGLLVASGALFQHNDFIWGVIAIGAAVILLGMSVSHNLLDNNYLIGYDAGLKEGSRARGLVSPESDLLEGSYRVLGRARLSSGWLVLLESATFEGQEPRVYQMASKPSPIFRKERWANPNDPESFIVGYRPVLEPV